MVTYDDEEVLAAPLDVIWKVLQDHRDDTKISTVHPLCLSQTTVSRTENESVVDRVIDVRGKSMKSRWKLTFRPPVSYRWEVVESDGPWAKGTFVEVRYDAVPGGTRVKAHGELSISVLPFFLSQKRTVARLLNDISAEDWNYINRYRF